MQPTPPPSDPAPLSVVRAYFEKVVAKSSSDEILLDDDNDDTLRQERLPVLPPFGSLVPVQWVALLEEYYTKHLHYAGKLRFLLAALAVVEDSSTLAVASSGLSFRRDIWDTHVIIAWILQPDGILADLLVDQLTMCVTGNWCRSWQLTSTTTGLTSFFQIGPQIPTLQQYTALLCTLWPDEISEVVPHLSRAQSSSTMAARDYTQCMTLLLHHLRQDEEEDEQEENITSRSHLENSASSGFSLNSSSKVDAEADYHNLETMFQFHQTVFGLNDPSHLESLATVLCPPPTPYSTNRRPGRAEQRRQHAVAYFRRRRGNNNNGNISTTQEPSSSLALSTRSLRSAAQAELLYLHIALSAEKAKNLQLEDRNKASTVRVAQILLSAQNVNHSCEEYRFAYAEAVSTELLPEYLADTAQLTLIQESIVSIGTIQREEADEFQNKLYAQHCMYITESLKVDCFALEWEERVDLICQCYAEQRVADKMYEELIDTVNDKVFSWTQAVHINYKSIHKDSEIAALKRHQVHHGEVMRRQLHEEIQRREEQELRNAAQLQEQAAHIQRLEAAMIELRAASRVTQEATFGSSTNPSTTTPSGDPTKVLLVEESVGVVPGAVGDLACTSMMRSSATKVSAAGKSHMELLAPKSLVVVNGDVFYDENIATPLIRGDPASTMTSSCLTTITPANSAAAVNHTNISSCGAPSKKKRKKKR